MKIFEDIFLPLIILLVVLFFVLTFFVFLPIAVNIDNQCNRLGYRDSDMVVLKGYCVSRINQTDVIVPLKELKNN